MWEHVGQPYSAFTGNWNRILWIEVVGGTLDPKNWMKANRAKPTDSTGAVVGDGASIVVGDAIRGAGSPAFSLLFGGRRSWFAWIVAELLEARLAWY